MSLYGWLQRRRVVIACLAVTTSLLTAPPLKVQGQTAPPPSNIGSGADNRYVVQVGPMTNRDRATAIARQLSAAGFTQARISAQNGFRVVSEPLPRSAADGLSATLAGRGIRTQVEPLGGETAQLLFGFFVQQKDADALSQRINAQGYDAWVREGTAYTIELGTVPQSALNSIAGIVKSGAPGAAVTANPVGAQSPPLSPPAPSSGQTPSAPTAAPAVPPPAAAPQPPTTGAQTSPPPSPVAVSENRYVVRVGPVLDRDRAAAIARQLSAGGFAQAKINTLTGFRVMSEPLPRSAADSLSVTLTGRGIHSQVEALGGDTAQLLFGFFVQQKDADALSQRISAQGYDAWVRGGTVYTLEIGPVPQSTVTTITGIVKSAASDAPIAADPIGAPAAPSPVAVAPSIPPAPSTTARPPSPPASEVPPGNPQLFGASPLPSPAPAAPAATASPGPLFLIVPGQSVGPVRVGAPLRVDVVALGPTRSATKLDDGTTLYNWYGPPNNIGIGVRADRNGIVLRVWVLNDARYGTKEGLHVGSNEAEVRAALGPPTRVETSTQAKTRTLIYESLGLWFGIQLDQQYNFYNTVFDIGVMSKK